MASHYLSPEASKARVLVAGRRLAAEYRAGTAGGLLESAAWAKIPRALRPVVVELLTDPCDRSGGLRCAVERAAVC